jgi:hypothetical protein
MFKLFRRKEDNYTKELDNWLAENERQRENAMKEIERISNILNNMEDIEND